MKNKISNIWIESEQKGPILNGELEINDNSDVIVTMNNGKRFIGTFFTYKNIEYLRQKYEETGECLGGKYFYAADMILIDLINRSEIEKVIFYMIEQNEFESAFRIIDD